MYQIVLVDVLSSHSITVPSGISTLKKSPLSALRVFLFPFLAFRRDSYREVHQQSIALPCEA